MAHNTEAIYEELFIQAKTVAVWASAQRRLRRLDDMKAVNTPALFQVQMLDVINIEKEAKRVGTKPFAEDLLYAQFLILVHSTGTEWPTSVLNPILDSVKNKFGVSNIPPGNKAYNTLNGLAQYAIVSGTIEIHEDYRSNSVLAVVPIQILTFIG